MVVVGALGARLGVASGPHANVHGIDGRAASSGDWMAGEELPQGLGVDSSAIQRGVEAAPATTVRRLEAQVDGRGDGVVGGEDGVGEFEEGVGPTVEAVVERIAEGSEIVVVGFHDAPIMYSPRAFRILCRQRG